MTDGGQLLCDRQQRSNLGDLQALIGCQVVNLDDGAGARGPRSTILDAGTDTSS
jgi:hypothetical protein